MIIVCPECSTKFRVNPERIPPSGAKVRCARCKHIFLAQIQPIEEPVAEEPVAEEPVAEEPVAEEPVAEEPVAEEPVAEEPVAEEPSFSYEKFQELDKARTDNDGFSLTDKTASEAHATDPKTQDSAETETAFSFPDFASEADQATQQDFGEPKQPSGQPVDEQKAQPAKKKANNGPTTSIMRILLLLLLGLAIIAGALYYLNGPDQISKVIEQVLSQQGQPVQAGHITLTNLEGKFIKNQEAGELFIIRGDAVNHFAEARAAIQVKAIIFDQAGKPLLQKTIYCGNPISDQELQTLPFDKLEEMMRNQFGKALNNMKVNSEESIPFVIAFRDLPKNIAEFSVDVTSSEPAGK